MCERGPRQIWVDQARNGDAEAASKLLATYHTVLRARTESRMGRMLQARLEPEDVLQQVYLEVLRKIALFEGRDSETFLNWILTILDHKLIDLRRALQRQMRDAARERRPRAPSGSESYINLLDQLYAHSGTPSREIRHDEAVGALLASMSRLSAAHRQVIQLRFLEGRPVGEVAARLQKTDAAVVALTRRALDALRRCMDGLGEFTRSS